MAFCDFGESRASTLLNEADVSYFLAVRDANDIPPANRADVALLLREGYLSVLPDATLRPREPLSRGRALHSVVRILEARSLLQLQKLRRDRLLKILWFCEVRRERTSQSKLVPTLFCSGKLAKESIRCALWRWSAENRSLFTLTAPV